MKKCQNCNANMADDDVFCTACGTKQGAKAENQSTYTPNANGNTSLFLKYSSYLDDEAIFKVAVAKEKGIVKSDFPDEAETIYYNLALKNHLPSMFRYAMILLNKTPPQTELAVKWLKIGAEKGQSECINYLNIMFPKQAPVNTYSSNAGAQSPSTTQKAPGSILSGEEIYAKLEDSVVEIIANDGKHVARASGFLVSSTGFVITNAHAVLDDKNQIYSHIEVKRQQISMPAVVLAVGRPADGKHNSADLALLFAMGLQDSRPAELGNSNSCRNGQKVYLVGNSLGSGICITSGIISDATRAMPGLQYPYIMTDAAANHGNSGGPLISEDGRVVGVLVSGIQDAEGMNFAIPINVVKDFLKYVISQVELDDTVLGELAQVKRDPSTMSSLKDKIFTGIHLIADVVAFILGFF